MMEFEIDQEESISIDITYEQFLFSQYQHALKRFIDWFVVKYNRWIEKRARVAATLAGMPHIYEDLKSETIIEAYNAARRFDQTRGTDIIVFLVSSLYHFPLRNDIIRRSRPYSSGFDDCEETLDALDAKAIAIHYAAIDDPAPVYSLEELTSGLPEQDRLLINFRYGLGLSNVALAQLCGLNESTIRYRVKSALEHLQENVKL